ncbi:hypothetical protein ACFL7D_04615 [candidate division KSB1 bacterium]
MLIKLFYIIVAVIIFRTIRNFFIGTKKSESFEKNPEKKFQDSDAKINYKDIEDAEFEDIEDKRDNDK